VCSGQHACHADVRMASDAVSDAGACGWRPGVLCRAGPQPGGRALHWLEGGDPHHWGTRHGRCSCRWRRWAAHAHPGLGTHQGVPLPALCQCSRVPATRPAGPDRQGLFWGSRWVYGVLHVPCNALQLMVLPNSAMPANSGHAGSTWQLPRDAGGTVADIEARLARWTLLPRSSGEPLEVVRVSHVPVGRELWHRTQGPAPCVSQAHLPCTPCASCSEQRGHHPRLWPQTGLRTR
jgi:hypothetical protein